MALGLALRRSCLGWAKLIEPNNSQALMLCEVMVWKATEDEDVEPMSTDEMLALEGSGWEGDLDVMRTDGHAEPWIDTGDLGELWELLPDPTLERDSRGFDC